MENQALEVHKPKKLITVSTNQITATQLKAYNYILRKIFLEVKTKEITRKINGKDEVFKEPLSNLMTFTHSELQEVVGANKTNNKFIFEELKALADVKVEYVQGNDWGVFHLIGHAIKIENEIEVGLPQPILRELFNKNYTTLDIIKIRSMSSKYTILMYELAEKHRGIVPPLLTVEELKKWLGISDKRTYDNFARVTGRLIDPALKELEAITGIKITYELKKKGVKYDTIRFSIAYPTKKLTNEQKDNKKHAIAAAETYKQSQNKKLDEEITRLEKEILRETGESLELMQALLEEKKIEKMKSSQ